MTTWQDSKNLVVIPARLHSKRLPGKLLLDGSGQALILHTLKRAVLSRKADHVLVATDAPEIYEKVREAGYPVCMTRSDHPSGTDRVAEVLEHCRAERIVNVQGDEPFVEAALIDDCFTLLEEEPEVAMATAVQRHESSTGLESPSTVKVVFNARHEALYFSRSLIPHCREETKKGPFFRHIGLYAFQRKYLLSYTQMPAGDLENREKLEQLRVLEQGGKIRVIETQYDGFSVDTPEEYEAFLKRLS
jgi:3-deoxy-manno-octulosonate cytidylyltransferase (CMP-KDO synthetase)